MSLTALVVLAISAGVIIILAVRHSQTGPAGGQGPAGPTGDAASSLAPTGDTGPTGRSTQHTGPTGSIGSTGPTPTGSPNLGPTGFAGYTGETGSTGLTGGTGSLSNTQARYEPVFVGFFYNGQAWGPGYSTVTYYSEGARCVYVKMQGFLAVTNPSQINPLSIRFSIPSAPGATLVIGGYSGITYPLYYQLAAARDPNDAYQFNLSFIAPSGLNIPMTPFEHIVPGATNHYLEVLLVTI